MVQEVRLVGGDEWWEAPLIAAAATFVVAAIAALTAERRLRKQLGTDLKIHEEKLAYDRQERNRDHVRNAMDDCVAGIRDAVLLLQTYEKAILEGEPRRAVNRLTAKGTGKLFDLAPETARQDLAREIEALVAPSAAVASAPVNLQSDNFRLQARPGSPASRRDEPPKVHRHVCKPGCAIEGTPRPIYDRRGAST